MSWMRAAAAKMAILGALLFGLNLSANAAMPERFVEGTHYFKLNKPVQVEDPNKIEVAEAFSYLCPHCYKLENALKTWKKTLPKDVNFVRKHAQFNRQYMAYAKLHLATQILGIEDKVHAGIFASVHEDRAMKMEPEDQYELVKSAGVKKEKFLKTMESFTFKTKLKKIEKDMLAYQITGVPAIIVNGKYRVSVSSAGSEKTMMELVDFLVDKERSAK